VLQPETGLTPLDWRLIVTHGMNALLEGDDDLTLAMVHALVPCLRAPVHSWWRPGSIAESAATLLVPDVGEMSAEEQNALFDWLSLAVTPRRVISTSSTAVFPLVECGQFRADLYYHLNGVLLRLRWAPDGYGLANSF
jgi:hypothetical protein